MSANMLAKLDECAVSLMKLYQKEGEFCVVVRSMRGDAANGDVRAICPQIGAEVTSEFLHRAAEILFCGPVTVRLPDSHE